MSVKTCHLCMRVRSLEEISECVKKYDSKLVFSADYCHASLDAKYALESFVSPECQKSCSELAKIVRVNS